MTYHSRSKTDFINVFLNAINNKFIAPSAGVNHWHSLSEFSGRLASSNRYDREFFYKAGTMILRPVIKDLMKGIDIEDYELETYEILVIYVGQYSQLEVRKFHNGKFQYRIVKAA